MVLEEIFIGVVFVAALLAAVACLVYLVYVTLLERHLLRARRNPVRANAARTVSSPAPTAHAATPAGWQRSPRSSSLPGGGG